MRKVLGKIYTFVETIPDRLYPFASEIEGQWVRGRRSYLNAVERAFAEFGPNRFGYKLTVYRATFHFIGSVLFIIFSALLARELFNSEIALYVLIAAAIAVLSYQEFYIHPRQYGQLRQKGVADWFTWVLPMVAYLALVSF